MAVTYQTEGVKMPDIKKRNNRMDKECSCLLWKKTR